MQIVIQAIILLIPPIVAAFYHLKLFNEHIENGSRYQLVTTTLLYFYSMIIIMSGVGCLRGHGGASYLNFVSTMGNILKYGVITGSLAIILPNVAWIGYTTIVGIKQKRSGEKNE